MPITREGSHAQPLSGALEERGCPRGGVTGSHRQGRSPRGVHSHGVSAMLCPAMRIDFTKMHGVGNDFVVFDAPADESLLAPGLLRRLGERRTGIGFDQALVLERPRREGTAVFYRIFNRDGDEVEQCGNGARCVAALLKQRGLAPGGSLTLDSPSGVAQARIDGSLGVSGDMGVPDFDPRSLPFDAPREADSYPLEVAGRSLAIAAVSIGNPHAVLTVPDVETAPVATLGPAIERHPRFAKRVNAGFLEIVSPAERQIEVLREKLSVLEGKLAELLRVARANDALSERLHRFTRRLLRAMPRDEALSRIEAGLREDFEAFQAVLVLIGEPSQAPATPRFVRAVPASDPNLKSFESLFATGKPRCGQARDSQREFLFGPEGPEMGSVALVPLGMKGSMGLLALGSADRERFHPAMSTEFLARLAELITEALSGSSP